MCLLFSVRCVWGIALHRKPLLPPQLQNIDCVASWRDDCPVYYRQPHIRTCTHTLVDGFCHLASKPEADGFTARDDRSIIWLTGGYEHLWPEGQRDSMCNGFTVKTKHSAHVRKKDYYYTLHGFTPEVTATCCCYHSSQSNHQMLSRAAGTHSSHQTGKIISSWIRFSAHWRRKPQMVVTKLSPAV